MDYHRSVPPARPGCSDRVRSGRFDDTESDTSRLTSNVDVLTPRPRCIGLCDVPGKGLCYIYADGSYIRTANVNTVSNDAHENATIPYLRLAQSCLNCKEKKIKCEPSWPKCYQCRKSNRAVCKGAISDDESDQQPTGNMRNEERQAISTGLPKKYMDGSSGAILEITAEEYWESLMKTHGSKDILNDMDTDAYSTRKGTDGSPTEADIARNARKRVLRSVTKPADRGLVFLTGNNPADFKSKEAMTTVRKQAMDNYLTSNQMQKIRWSEREIPAPDRSGKHSKTTGPEAWVGFDDGSSSITTNQSAPSAMAPQLLANSDSTFVPSQDGSRISETALKRVESDEGIGARTQMETETGLGESKETRALLGPEPQVRSLPPASSLGSEKGKIGKEAVSRVTLSHNLHDRTSSDGSLAPVHPTLTTRLPAFHRAKTHFGTITKPAGALRSSRIVAPSLQHAADNDHEDEASASVEKSPMLRTSGLEANEPVVSEQNEVATNEDVSVESLTERRRLQNRIAQKNFRNRMRARLEAAENRVAETKNTRLMDEPAETIQTGTTTRDDLDPEVMVHQRTNESVNIRCACGIENDRRFIIPCMQCGTWQHIACYYELAADIVELHECIQCVPRELNGHARDTLKRQADAHWPEGTSSSMSRWGKRPRNAGAESSIWSEDDDLSSIATDYTVPSGVKPRLSSLINLPLAHTPSDFLKDWNRVDFTFIVPPSPSTSDALSRTSHKIAEQGRRNRINIALQDMQKLLPESQLDALGPDGFAARSSSSKAANVERAVDYIQELLEQVKVKDELLASKDQELERVREENTSLQQALNAPGPIASGFEFLQVPDSGDEWGLLAQGPLWPNCSDTPMQNMAVAAFRERQQQDISVLETQSSQMENQAKSAALENQSLQARILQLMDELREARAEIPAEAPEDELLDDVALTSLRATEVNVLTDVQDVLQIDWTRVQRMLPDTWMWDVEYQADCWTCTPLEVDEPKLYPLIIAGAPVVLPVESSWPPMGGVNPPPDPRPLFPVDCRAEITVDVARDVFLTFGGSIGFYMLINGLLQIIVPDEFDTEWASSHFPHKYGGLKVCYIPQTMEATMLPTTTETTQTRPTLNQQSSGLSNIFGRHSLAFVGPSHPTLKLNDFIEARPKAGHRKEKYAGRIGLKMMKDGSPYLTMSTHIITEAIMAKSHRDAIFGRGRDSFQKLDADWNEHVEIWAGNDKIGWIEESCDKGAELYPNGFRHDVTLIKPFPHIPVNDIVSPIADLGWLNRESWSSLRQKPSATKILGPTENHRSSKTLKCSRPSEILVVGEGVFLNQTAAASSSKPLKDYDVSTWKDLISRALLYRVSPDFDPPNGYSGVALYADGTREDGSVGPGIAGFQSFVQRSGHVQNFNMEGPALERRLQLGRVAFYGAFEVPEVLKREYRIV